MASMLELIERHPHAAAITGQPRLPPGARLPFAEKLNVVANLMDVVPASAAAELVPVGFAEGRCDVFRVEALRAVGLYDTHLRVSGEDQVLAAKLRANGLRDLPGAAARVSPLGLGRAGQRRRSSLRHQRLFGRTTPVHRPGRSRQPRGPRREARRREPQSAQRCCGRRSSPSSAAYALVAAVAPRRLAGLAVGRCAGPRRRRQGARSSRGTRGPCASRSGSWLAFVLLQPALDLAFTAGHRRGLLAARARSRRPID